MNNKLITPLFLILGLLLSLSGCKNDRVIYRPVIVKSYPKKMPPGQAKKVYGHQSAKAFAPGQQKKNKNLSSVKSNGHKGPKGKGKVK